MPRKGSINRFSKETLGFANEYGKTKNWVRLSVRRVMEYIEEAKEDAREKGYVKRTPRSQREFVDEQKRKILKLIPLPEMEKELEDQDTQRLEAYGLIGVIDFVISNTVEDFFENEQGFIEFYDKEGNLLIVTDDEEEFNDALRDEKIRFSAYVEMDVFAKLSVGGTPTLVVQVTNYYDSDYVSKLNK